MKFLFPLLLTAVLSFQAFAQSGLKVGDQAPAFTGINQHGEALELQTALKSGPVVLVFYRGYWCPFCKKALSQLQDSLQLLTDKGVTVVAVSPETAGNAGKTVQKTSASFHVISDEGLSIMRAYDVAYPVDDDTKKKYKGYGLDFDEINGQNGANLPVPATFLIGTDGTIRYVFFDPDYKNRASVASLLQAL